MWIIESILLAIAMAMDAFAVSITNGLSEPNMKKRKVLAIAITFGAFQGLMPLIGFLVGSVFEKWIAYFVPVIGFVILTYLGINMIRGALKCECEECKPIIGLKVNYRYNDIESAILLYAMNNIGYQTFTQNHVSYFDHDYNGYLSDHVDNNNLNLSYYFGEIAPWIDHVAKSLITRDKYDHVEGSATNYFNGISQLRLILYDGNYESLKSNANNCVCYNIKHLR
jgi:MFS family permease